MSDDVKLGSIIASAIVIVLCTLMLSIRSYNVRWLENDLEMRKAAFAAGLCEVQNTGGGGTHYEKCK